MKLTDVKDRLTFGAEIETLACSECNGRGYITCPYCEEGQVDCPECEGRGRVTCSECDGEGEVACPECEGRGCITCPECNGEGCEYCNGTGEIECSKCEGYGHIACPECDGAGEVECPECDGWGRGTCPDCDGDYERPCSCLDIVPWEMHHEHCGQEFVSPVYKIRDYGTFLDEAYNIIQEMEFDSYTSDPTGMHIHVGIVDVFDNPPAVLSRLADVWEVIEYTVVHDIACTSEYRESYCKEWQYKNSYVDSEYVKDKIKDGNMSFNRYATLNYDAYQEHGTVEFRLWNSPNNIRDVMTAVEVSTAVVVYAWLRSHDNLPITEEQVIGFINRWGSYMRGLTYWEAA